MVYRNYSQFSPQLVHLFLVLCYPDKCIVFHYFSLPYKCSCCILLFHFNHLLFINLLRNNIICSGTNWLKWCLKFEELTPWLKQYPIDNCSFRYLWLLLQQVSASSKLKAQPANIKTCRIVLIALQIIRTPLSSCFIQAAG